MMSPSDDAGLVEAVAGATGPLDIVGGGTRPTGRSPRGETVAVAGLSGISLYEPGALTMVAGAGTPVSEIEAALAAEGQMLAFEPLALGAVTGAGGASTIGGIFATNASGPRRIQGGAARDYLLGVRFVDGLGRAVKNGGRVMKNVTGYDLVKLMAGAHGTLGVLSEVSFKTLPRAEAQATIEIRGLSDADAIATMSTAMGSPFDVSGAMHASAGVEDAPVTRIRVEGFTDSVAYRADELAKRLDRFGEVHHVEGREAWDAARHMAPFAKSAHGDGGAVWSITVKPSDAPAFMAGVERFGCRYTFDWAGGRIFAGLGKDGDQAGFHAALQAAVGETGGQARLLHGPAALSDAIAIFQPEAAPLAKLAAGLRARFDPRGIFNTGLMG